MKGAFVEREHAADIFLEIHAADLAGLYEHALYSLYAVLVEPVGIRPLQERAIAAAGAEAADTLRNLLGEALFVFESEGFVAAGADFTEASAQRASALLWGEPLDPSRHEPLTEVKAVTYHRLSASRTPAGDWSATVILDV
jgi:SHS2 domain-containing protein